MSRWKTGPLLLALCAFPGSAAAVGWLPPDVLTAPGLTASSVQMEASGSGTLTAAYRVLDGGVQKVFARDRVPGGAWSVPVAISAPTGDVIDFDLAVGPDGTAAVAWTKSDGVNDVVVVRVRPAGGGAWGAPDVLSAGAGADARLPRVAVDGAGLVEAVWIRGAGPSWAVESRTRPTASAWNANTYTLGTGAEPSELDIDTAGGHAAVAWVQQISADRRVYGVVRDGGGGTWPLAAIINMSLTSGTNVDVAVAPDGNAAVAYFHEEAGPTFTVRASRRPPAGTFATTGDAVAVGDINSGDIALVMGGGEATVAWSRPDGPVRRIDAAGAPLGSAFGPPATVSEAGFSARSPQLDLDSAGGVAAIWRQTEAAGEVIVGRMRPPGALWDPPLRTSPSAFAADPVVSALPGGEAAAAWPASSGGVDAAHAAILDRTPPVPASVVVPPATRVGEATSFAVSFTDLWGLSLVAPRWDFGDGGRADGATVTHVFGLPGTYTVRLEHGDAAFNPFLMSHEVRVDPIPPKAETTKSTFSGTTTAQFEGTVWPSGRVTQYHFEYGRTTAYGRRTATMFTPAPVGRFDVKRVATGLVPGVTYHYRLVATAGADTNRGADRTVTTLAPPATFAAPGGGTKVPVAARGSASIVARCAKACRGSVGLFTMIHPRHGKASKAVEMRHRRRVRIGSRSFSRTSAGTTTLTVQLSAAGRALLAAQGTIRAYIVANIRSGGRTVRTTTNVTLVASTKKVRRNAELSRR